jgi:hypothetical protein
MHVQGRETDPQDKENEMGILIAQVVSQGKQVEIEEKPRVEGSLQAVGQLHASTGKEFLLQISILREVIQ